MSRYSRRLAQSTAILLLFVVLVLGAHLVYGRDKCQRAIAVKVPVVTVYPDGVVIVTHEQTTVTVDVPCEQSPPSTARGEMREVIPIKVEETTEGSP